MKTLVLLSALIGAVLSLAWTSPYSGVRNFHSRKVSADGAAVAFPSYYEPWMPTSAPGFATSPCRSPAMVWYNPESNNIVFYDGAPRWITLIARPDPELVYFHEFSHWLQYSLAGTTNAVPDYVFDGLESDRSALVDRGYTNDLENVGGLESYFDGRSDIYYGFFGKWDVDYGAGVPRAEAFAVVLSMVKTGRYGNLLDEFAPDSRAAGERWLEDLRKAIAG